MATPGDHVAAERELIVDVRDGEAQFGDAVSLHEPGSIVVFEDHSSYMDESPAHVRAGLVPNMVAMCETQRGFAAAHGLRQHRTLTDAEAAADDGRNVAGI